MPSPIPGPIPDATATVQGQVSTTAQTFGGLKTFEAGAVTSPYDIRLYGAVSAATSYTASQATTDCAPAIKAAIAAWTQSGNNVEFRALGPTGGIDLSTGNWYVGSPVVLPPNTVIDADGQQLANIIVGPGTPSTPGLVQGFAGPVFYMGGIDPNSSPGNGFPSYTTPLVGSTGQSMALTTFSNLAQPIVYPASVLLDDSWPWSTFFTWVAGAFSLQCWAKSTAWPAAQGRRTIIGNYGIEGESAFVIYANSDGTNVIFVAGLTTYNQGFQTITGSTFAANVAHNLEIDYNGSFFDFYVDGINQGHLAATGQVVKIPYSTTTIGDGDGTEVFGFGAYQITGAIDSIRLSNTARHTGTGSFTPPTVKYAWDTNTLWLCNFDQTAPTVAMPFLQAQTVISTVPGANGSILYSGPATLGQPLAAPAIGGPNQHYCRLGGWSQLSEESFGAANSTLSNFTIICNDSSSGIVGYGSSHSTFKQICVSRAAQWGFCLTDGFSFYSRMENCISTLAIGVGIAFSAECGCYNPATSGCGIGMMIVDGYVDGANDQPGWNEYVPFIWGGIGGEFSTLTVTNSGNDEEGLFQYQVASALVFGDSSITFINNEWAANSGKPGAPAVLYGSGKSQLSKAPVTHIGDEFFPYTAGGISGVPCITTTTKAPVTPPFIQLINCQTYGQLVTDVPGLIAQLNPGTSSGIQSISTTPTSGSNLAGTFTIQFGYTSGGPTFTTPEPDGRYVVNISYLGHYGSTPAAGSTTPGPYTTSATGFNMVQGTSPGGTCTTVWSYTIIRVPGAPLAFDYIPTIPSTITNPLAGETGPFYAAATLVPVVGHSLVMNNTLGFQVVTEAGTPTTNWWQFAIQNGWQLQGTLGTSAIGLTVDSFVSNGHLYGIMNPGTHNVVFGIDNNVPAVIGDNAAVFFVDGALGAWFLPSGGATAGTQQTPIRIGNHSAGVDTLTCATLRNEKVDTVLSQVVTYEQDSGPQTGNAIAAIFGDQMTLGLNAGTANIGGFATQIANNRYGTTYYYLAAVNQGTFLGSVLPTFWNQWGGLQSGLAGICLMSGFYDCLNGATGASVWAGMQLMLNGQQATATFTPPIQNNQAFAICYNNLVTWSAAQAFVINGVTFNCPFTTDQQTSWTNFAAAVNASSPTNTLVTALASYNAGSGIWACLLTAVAPGSSGNGIPVTATGIGQVYSPALPNQTGNGGNATLTIQGVTFQVFFTTNADTTVNNLITLINASSPTLALVTPTLVAHQLVLTAVASGAVGNGIAVSTNSADGASLPAGQTTLLGGVNGAIQNGINPIVLCTVPPFGNAPGYTSAKDTQRVALNTSILAFTGTGVHIADVDATLRYSSNHTLMNPTYLSSDNTNPNDAGHAALYSLISPLLP